MIQIDTQDSRFSLERSRFDSPVYIGRDPDMQVVLTHWRVARQHAVLIERSHTLWIKDLGTWSGTWVNHKRIVAETPVLEEDDIRIGSCIFRARWMDVPVTTACQVQAHGLADRDGLQPEQPGSDLLPMGSPPVNAPGERAGFACHDEQVSRPVPSESDPGSTQHSVHKSGESSGLISEDAPERADAEAAAPLSAFDAARTRQRLQSMLLNALDLRREDVSGMSDLHLRARAQAILEALIDHDPDLCPADQRTACIKAVVDEAVGLGPLEPLLADDGISEIMVNRYDEIYVERAGRLERAAAAFANDMSVLSVLERIVAPLGRRIDESSPMVDARLSDGSRVNGVIAPIALKGPALTIRKFARRKLQLADLVAGATLSSNMAAFLALCVAHKKNMVVSGGTGSGKTTLLNILSGLIGQRERIITIEDAAELQLPHEHVVALEARPANIEGRGRVDIRDLVRNALRMRPDRIVVGECRGAEAFDMLAAMNTGHEGSLTTLHANTPRDALARLETMILMTGMPLPLAAVREHISSGIDIIVQQARLDSGQRVLTDIAEVTGMDSGGIQLQTLFSRHKGHGGFTGAGVLPSFVEAWRERGIEVPAHWFDR